MTARPDGPAGAPGAAPAPVNVVVGEEELLVERSVSALIAAARYALAADDAPAWPVRPVRLTERVRVTQPPRRETSMTWRAAASPWAS